MSRYRLISFPQSVSNAVPTAEFAKYLLQLPHDDNPIQHPVLYVRYWVPSQAECFHFSYITADRVCKEVRSMLGKMCAGYDGVSIIQVFDVLPKLFQFLADRLIKLSQKVSFLNAVNSLLSALFPSLRIHGCLLICVL